MDVGVLPATQTERRMLMQALSMLTLLAGVAFVSRPIIPIDETRYLGVAWEMWLRGDFLLPFKNGAPYSQKPPLMMWLFQAGWAVAGVNEWWPRLVSPLASVCNLLLTISLARRLWPDRTGIGGTGVLILVSSLLWSAFSTMVMFDMLLAFFTLVGMHGTLLATKEKSGRGIVLLGMAIGLGVLTKGPVILLHVLPVALLAPWWHPGLRWSRWFGSILVAVLIGTAIALIWAVPAGLAGGEAYRKTIFWGQSAERMVQSFAHRHPPWWYLPHLPLMLFPWLIWPGLWRTLNSFFRQELDQGGRFCLAWMLPVTLIFSFISGKQMQYLLPVFPAFALLAARSMADVERVNGFWLPALAVFSIGGGLLASGRIILPMREGLPATEIWPLVLLMLAALAGYLVARRLAKPVVTLAVLGVAVNALVHLAIFSSLYPAYDIRPMAEAIRQVQANGHVVAHDGTYHDQYQFAGRLQAPLLEIESTEALKTWLASHPHDHAVIYAKDMEHLQRAKTIVVQPYRGGSVALFDAPSALSFLTQNAKQ